MNSNPLLFIPGKSLPCVHGSLTWNKIFDEACACFPDAYPSFRKTSEYFSLFVKQHSLDS